MQCNVAKQRDMIISKQHVMNAFNVNNIFRRKQFKLINDHALPPETFHYLKNEKWLDCISVLVHLVITVVVTLTLTMS